MLSREELKEIAKIRGDEAQFVSFFLNVNPMTNVKDNYIIHVKNLIKNTADTLEKDVLKKVAADLEKIESYVMTNKPIFKKGLVIISSQEKKYWKEFHLSVPIKNEIIVDKTPYIKPLLDIMDNYQRYAVLLVGKESARIFVVHLGEIEEYSEVHTDDVPGKHKKGGWYALSEKSYERHTDHMVGLHLKDVLKQLDAFLSGEYVGRLIIGGSDETVTKVKSMLPQTTAEKIIGTFQAEMIATGKDVLEKAGPVLQAFENRKEAETIDDLLTKAMKNENAVIGVENVLNAIQEGRVMRLILLKDFKQTGLACKECGHLTVQNISSCPYCKGEVESANYLVDMIAQKAIEQGAGVAVSSENKKLRDAGSIGAFLRF
jgi:peptide chain release factor subunit 1